MRRGILWPGVRASRVDGGLIFVKAANRAKAQALLESDPFITEKLADLTVIEWIPRFAFPGLEAFHG